MIGILIVAHDKLGDSLIGAVTHVLGGRPSQFESLGVSASDDPLMLLPKAREMVKSLDSGDGVLIFSDIYGATPCNLPASFVPGASKVSRVSTCPCFGAFTCPRKGHKETMIKKRHGG
jgi:mannose/fructose-specific phosphotransferase system component IIA